jgi:hypothetical protein
VRQSLALDQLALRPPQLRRHVVDGVGEQAQLGAIAEHDRRAEVAAADALDAGPQQRDGAEQVRHQRQRRDRAEREHDEQHDHLLASRGPDHRIEIVEPEAHVRGADLPAIAMADGHRGDEPVPVRQHELAAIELFARLRRLQCGFQLEYRAEHPRIRIAQHAAVDAHDGDERELGLTLAHLADEGMERQLGKLGQHRVAARERQVAGHREQAALDLARQRLARVALGHRADRDHGRGDERDSGEGHDPADADAHVACARRYVGRAQSFVPSRSRVRDSCCSARCR